MIKMNRTKSLVPALAGIFAITAALTIAQAQPAPGGAPAGGGEMITPQRRPAVADVAVVRPRQRPRPDLKTQPMPSDFGVKPDAPLLAYHDGPNPVAPLGEKFGNVASVALRPNGDLLVFNRNPDIAMIEYDPTGTTVKKVFNPNIADNPHSIRVDSHGNLWVVDGYLGLIYKFDNNDSLVKIFGTRGRERGPWDDSKWDGMFNQPMDVAVDKDDTFYVVQSHGGSSGGSQGEGRGQFGPARPEVRQERQLHHLHQLGASRWVVSHPPYRDGSAQWRCLGG